MSEITTEQRANLKTLSEYLKQPVLKAEFDMSMFTSFDGTTHVSRSIDCGSCGCAIGHGPYAGISKLSTEDWLAYSKRVFYDSNNRDTWNFLFNDNWANIDETNTALQAAARIDYFLVNGVPDEDTWSYEDIF
jgi:hypothetical protein